MTPDRPQQITVVQLADETIDQLAARVANVLAELGTCPAADRDDRSGPTGLLSAVDVSRWWGVERGWVYQHADQLGAIRLGAGRRPRLRFDPDRVRRAMGDPLDSDDGDEPNRPRRSSKPQRGGSRSTTADSLELLPIHGEQSYRR